VAAAMTAAAAAVPVPAPAAAAMTAAAAEEIRTAMEVLATAASEASGEDIFGDHEKDVASAAGGGEATEVSDDEADAVLRAAEKQGHAEEPDSGADDGEDDGEDDSGSGEDDSGSCEDDGEESESDDGEESGSDDDSDDGKAEAVDDAESKKERIARAGEGVFKQFSVDVDAEEGSVDVGRVVVIYEKAVPGEDGEEEVIPAHTAGIRALMMYYLAMHGTASVEELVDFIKSLRSLKPRSFTSTHSPGRMAMCIYGNDGASPAMHNYIERGVFKRVDGTTKNDFNLNAVVALADGVRVIGSKTTAKAGGRINKQILREEKHARAARQKRKGHRIREKKSKRARSAEEKHRSKSSHGSSPSSPRGSGFVFTPPNKAAAGAATPGTLRCARPGCTGNSVCQLGGCGHTLCPVCYALGLLDGANQFVDCPVRACPGRTVVLTSVTRL
jgi:hypothetical protein